MKPSHKKNITTSQTKSWMVMLVQAEIIDPMQVMVARNTEADVEVCIGR
jgi:hypothetical protein